MRAARDGGEHILPRKERESKKSEKQRLFFFFFKLCKLPLFPFPLSLPSFSSLFFFFHSGVGASVSPLASLYSPMPGSTNRNSTHPKPTPITEYHAAWLAQNKNPRRPW